MASVYEKAWNQLKENPNEPLVLAAHPAHHRRIYKAIIKRKNVDTVFHYLMSEQGKVAKLSKKSEAGSLKIFLTISFKVEGLFK